MRIPRLITGIVLFVNAIAVGADKPNFPYEAIVDDAEAWRLLEVLRDRKNLFFEGCITDRTREIFGQRKQY